MIKKKSVTKILLNKVQLGIKICVKVKTCVTKTGLIIKYEFSQKSKKMEIKEKSNIWLIFVCLHCFNGGGCNYPCMEGGGVYLPLYPPYPCFIWIHDTGGRNSSSFLHRVGGEAERGKGVRRMVGKFRKAEGGFQGR